MRMAVLCMTVLLSACTTLKTNDPCPEFMKLDPGKSLQETKNELQDKGIWFNQEGADWVNGTVFVRDELLTLRANKTKAWCDAREH